MLQQTRFKILPRMRIEPSVRIRTVRKDIAWPVVSTVWCAICVSGEDLREMRSGAIGPLHAPSPTAVSILEHIVERYGCECRESFKNVRLEKR